MKREQGEEMLYRPPSTGSAPDHNVLPTYSDARYQQQHFPPFDVAQHPRTQAYQPAASYVSRSPVPGNEPYGHPADGNSGLPLPRQEYGGVSYHAPIGATQKRKAHRASQACDSCRQLKAKCEEGRPLCSSCKEKGIPCVYRDPPPKQPDRTAAEIVHAIQRMESNIVETVQNAIAREMSKSLGTLSERLSRVEDAVFPSHVVTKDFDSSRQATDFQVPARRLASAQYSAQPSGPPAATMTTPVLEGPPTHLSESPFPSNTSQQLGSDMAVDATDTEEEDEDSPPVNPGQPSIPVNHTTGAARLLLNSAIKELAHGVIKSDKIKNENYPMLQEERRGLLRVFGRGEGTEQLPGYEGDPLIDSGKATEGNIPTPSDSSSDAGSPEENWGQLSGLPGPDVVQRGQIGQHEMPDLDPVVVRALVQSYLDHINIMHPILVPAKLEKLVRHFLGTIPDNALKAKTVTQLAAGFVAQPKHPESPSNKRKFSHIGDGNEQPNPIVPDYKPGLPFRSIGTALVLLVMALGEICQWRTKIPDCIGGNHDGESSWGSPALRNGHPVSPSALQRSPSMSTVSGLPSPMNGERTESQSRRASVNGLLPARNTSGSKPRNLDVIPGLKYFAFATDILGNQASGNSLQHVHANILASLYHGQLGRPLESHSYLHQACRSLQVILRPKLDRLKGITLPSLPLPKDNQLVIAFWTCLQLESDIVAELPVPHSGILTYEKDMPGLNITAAVEIDKFNEGDVMSYAAQLLLRKHLNSLHSMFYKPANDSEFPLVFSGKRQSPFNTIEAYVQNLDAIKVFLKMDFKDDDPPATDILTARFRAKYWGAKVITYRPFIEMILEHSSKKRAKKRAQGLQESPQPRQHQEFASGRYKTGIDVSRINDNATRLEDLPNPIKDYAKAGIKALINSTTAFHGLGDPTKQRLIVTNVFGTAHAQWGNLLTLQAASVDPILGDLIDKHELRDLYDKTMGFLKLTAQPASAIYIDCKILEYVAREIKLIPKTTPVSSSFSYTGGDVPMTGQ